MYFKAADVLVLPYNEIFQSGVLFLGYSFGLPVIATDVGSFREEIVEGRTGFLCRPAIRRIWRDRSRTYLKVICSGSWTMRRQEIRDYANDHHSWDVVGERLEGVRRTVAGGIEFLKPLVSILIPAFNAQEWIADTLRSAIAQTWETKEIIVVDDGSSIRLWRLRGV